MAGRRTKNKSRRGNFLTLILSVIIAMVAWLILSVTAFSDVTVTLRDVEIDFSLDGSYADLLGLSIVERDIDTVNVSFVGQRDSVGNYTNDDIRVSLDLNNVRTSGTYDIPLVVTSVNGDQINNIEIGPQKTVHIEFDVYSTKTLSVADNTLVFDMSNVSAYEGYVIDPSEIVLNPAEVTISGPSDYISQVTSAVVSFDTAYKLNQSQNKSTSVITLYSDQAVFENPRVTVDSNLFNVYIPVYLTKKLPLTLTIQSYTDKIDVSTIPYTLSDDSITVRSQNSDLNRISNISLGVMELRNIRPGTVGFFTIQQNSNYENISGIIGVQAQFNLEGYAEKDITLNNSQIHMINTMSEFNVTVETDRLNVKVVGPEEVLDQLDSMSFVAEIDLMEYAIAPGGRFFTATIYAPGYNNVWALGQNTVFANVEEVPESEEVNDEAEQQEE